jgi:hypothetical protein
MRCRAFADARRLHELGETRNVLGRRKLVAVRGEYVLLGHGDHPPGDAVHVAPELAELLEDGVERDPCSRELGAGVKQSRAGDAEPLALRLEDPETHPFLEQLHARLRAEHLEQLLGRDVGRHLVGPLTGERFAEAHQLADLVAALERLDQLADVRERVAAVEQLADQLQAREVRLGVQPDASLATRRRNQAAVLVGADVADGGARFAGQLVDAVFGHGAQRYAEAAGETAR